MFEAYDIYKGLNEIMFKDLDEVFTLYKPKSFYVLNDIADDILFLTIDRYKGYKTLMIDIEDYMDDTSVGNIIVLVNDIPCNLHDNYNQYLMNNKIYIVSDYINKNTVTDVKIFNIKKQNVCKYNVSITPNSFNSITQTLLRINKNGVVSTSVSDTSECLNIVINLPSVKVSKTSHIYDLSKSLIKPTININNGKFTISDTDIIVNKHMTKINTNDLTLVFYRTNDVKCYYTDFLNKYRSNVDEVSLTSKDDNIILKELFHLSDIESLSDEDKFEYIESLDIGLFDRLYNEKYRTHETINTFSLKNDIGKAISNTTNHGVTFNTPRIYFAVDNMGQTDYEVYINGKFIHQHITCINNLSVSHIFLSLYQIYDITHQSVIRAMCNQNAKLKDKVTASFTSFEAGVNILECQFENDISSFLDIFGDIILSDMKINIIRRYNDYNRFETGVTKKDPIMCSIPDVINTQHKPNVFVNGRHIMDTYYRTEFIGGIYHLIFNDTMVFDTDDVVIPVTITYYDDGDDVVDIKISQELSTDKYIEGVHNLDTDYYIDGINMNHTSVCCTETSTKTYFDVTDSSNTNVVTCIRRFDLSELHKLRADYRDLLITSLNILATVRNSNFATKTFTINKVNVPTDDINFETYIVYLKYFINTNSVGSVKGILSADDILYIKNNYPHVVINGDTIALTSWVPLSDNTKVVENKSKYLMQHTKTILETSTGDIKDNGYVLTGEYRGQSLE